MQRVPIGVIGNQVLSAVVFLIGIGLIDIIGKTRRLLRPVGNSYLLDRLGIGSWSITPLSRIHRITCFIRAASEIHGGQNRTSD
jgi:hypothetical protein